MLEDFKKFAMRGNVIDLAVGVIIGAAFGSIVSSLVGDVIMPIIGAITGGLDFSNYFLPLSSKVTADSLGGSEKARCRIGLGKFHHDRDQFPHHCLRIVRGDQGHYRPCNARKPPSRPSRAKPSREAELLTEIRDLLKKA